jgi:DHA1 family tetracycline resistance protein-like MFS transporter
MTQVFAFFTAINAPIYFPGAPFIGAGVLTVFALAVFLRATQTMEPTEKSPEAVV